MNISLSVGQTPSISSQKCKSSNKSRENFTVYQINYKTNITPLNGNSYRRCICSGMDDCRCIDDSNYELMYDEYSREYPSCYFQEA